MKHIQYSLPIALMAIMACNPPSTNKVEEQVTAFDLHNLDSTASPCGDFYQYAVGNWMKDNPVPETESRWMSFNILAEENRQKLLSILEGLKDEKNIEVGSNKQMIKDLFASGIDSTDHTEERLAAVKGILEEIASTQNYEEMQALFPSLSNSGIGGYFRYGVGRDSKNSEQYILSTGQSGLTLPDRDYYLVENDKFNQIKDQYISHIDLMFEMAGYSPKDFGVTVYEVEKQIAEISWPRQELRNRNKTYNKKNIDDWDATLSHIQVRKILEGNHIKADSINVRQPSYFESLDGLVASIDHEKWVVYLQWKALTSYGPYINPSFENEDFAFFNKTLRGIEKMKPKNERVLGMVNGGLGEAMGELFVDKHFSEESKQYMANLIENLRTAYKESIENLTWMTDETKEKALKKLASFTYKVGYPDEWKDYSSIEISPDDLMQNIMNIRKFNFQYRIAKLGQPVDKNEWHMTPQMVNAYYSSSGNEIVFPAGILQPPFFHPSFDDAINYGGIGAVIGHEFTHGFDDQGSKSDWNGNLNNWWTSEDSIQFRKLTQQLVAQFDGFNAIDSSYVNGNLTLGENIADLGGLTLAFEALKKQYNGNPPAPIDGFTWQQRFYLGWANVWKGNIRDEELRNRLMTDSHSPARFRVLGPLENLPAFYEAFDCEMDSTFNPIKIW